MSTTKQPAVFKLSFWITMCERFGFYVLSFVLVLYAQSEFKFTDIQAFELYAVFCAFCYLASAVGGYLADNIYGIRRCMIVGLLLEGIGLLMLAIPERAIFAISLAMIIAGVGLFKTTPTHLLGRSYAENDSRIDSGFTLYYIGVNIGSLISSLLIGVVQRYFGWHAAFVMGGSGILLGLLFYFGLRHSAKPHDSQAGLKKLSTQKLGYAGAGLIVSFGLFAYFINHPNIAYYVYSFCAIGLAGYFIYEIIKSSPQDRNKIIACLSLIMMSLVFFIMYQQAYTSIVLFINRSVNRNCLGFEIPTTAFFALNALWVIILGPILSWIYNHLGRKNRDISIAFKFSFGLGVTSLCFFTLYLGGHFANSSALISPFWVVLAYLFYTLGEMLVSALGNAMVTRVAPKRLYGIMMGTMFFVGLSLSAILSGAIANTANVPASIQDPATILNIYTSAFFKIGAVSLFFVAVAFLVSPFINRMLKNDA